MSLLAALTIKVSAILLLALIGALCLRTRSASARHWVLAVGVVSAVAAPALHVLPFRRWCGWLRSDRLRSTRSDCAPTSPSQNPQMPVCSDPRRLPPQVETGRVANLPAPATPSSAGWR